MTCSSWNSSSDLLRRLRHRHRPTSQRMAALAWTSTEEELAVFTVHLLLALHLQICRIMKGPLTSQIHLDRWSSPAAISDPPRQMVVPVGVAVCSAVCSSSRTRSRSAIILIGRINMIRKYWINCKDMCAASAVGLNLVWREVEQDGETQRVWRVIDSQGIAGNKAALI
uniref:Uncharacterized protein n=1 Tax=Oryza rufipogon TaxID=4529 RepID=A0A0E0PSS7_ORYRU